MKTPISRCCALVVCMAFMLAPERARTEPSKGCDARALTLLRNLTERRQRAVVGQRGYRARLAAVQKRHDEALALDDNRAMIDSLLFTAASTAVGAVTGAVLGGVGAMLLREPLEASRIPIPHIPGYPVRGVKIDLPGGIISGVVTGAAVGMLGGAAVRTFVNVVRPRSEQAEMVDRRIAQVPQVVPGVIAFESAHAEAAFEALDATANEVEELMRIERDRMDQPAALIEDALYRRARGSRYMSVLRARVALFAEEERMAVELAGRINETCQTAARFGVRQPYAALDLGKAAPNRSSPSPRAVLAISADRREPDDGARGILR